MEIPNHLDIPDHPDGLFPSFGPVGGGYFYPDGSAMIPDIENDGKLFYVPACIVEEMIPDS